MKWLGFNDTGTIDFNVLTSARPSVIYYLFDLLEVEGESIIREPLAARRQLLRKLYVPQRHIQLVEAFDELDPLLIAVRSMGLEGVVAKRLDSPYEPGKRSRKWRKHILTPHSGWQH